jgi:hypothetical protein
MKSALRNLTSWLILFAAWLATGSVAEAVAPLPNTRIDQVYSQRATSRPLIQVLPDWARADLGSPLSVREGRGYFASSVRSLKESLKQPDDRKGKSERVRKAMKTKRVRDRAGSSTSSEPEGGQPQDREDVSGLGKGYADLPMFHEPLDRPYGRRPSVPPGRQATQGQVPEPPGSTLIGIAMIGWLVTARRRPR